MINVTAYLTCRYFKRFGYLMELICDSVFIVHYVCCSLFLSSVVLSSFATTTAVRITNVHKHSLTHSFKHYNFSKNKTRQQNSNDFFNLTRVDVHCRCVYVWRNRNHCLYTSFCFCFLLLRIYSFFSAPSVWWCLLNFYTGLLTWRTFFFLPETRNYWLNWFCWKLIVVLRIRIDRPNG